MGDTITSGRWVLDYANKRVYRATSVTPTTVDLVNTLYSDIQDVMDDAQQMDDSVPISAQTPTEYTIINQWFIDDESPKYLKTGAIKTSGWVSGTTKYVRRLAYNPQVLDQFPSVPAAADGQPGLTEFDDETMTVNHDFTVADIGRTLTGTKTGDTGTILNYDRYRGLVWVRPDDPTAGGDEFDIAEDFTVSANSFAQGRITSVSRYGEVLWSNIFGIGTVTAGTREFVIQDARKITQWPPSIGLRADGHLDVLIKVQEQTTTGADFIDDGYLTVYAREGSRLFDHFETDVSSGGRNPIPLSTGSDVNDEIGHHNVPFDAGSGSTLVVGEIFRKDGDTEVAGVVAAVTGAASATGTIDYFLLRQLTQFTDNDPCTAETSTKTFNINGTPTDLAPVTDTDIVFTFGGYTRNINNGNGLRPYSISVDPNAKSFARVYRRAKYITRRGSKFNINSEYGEAYRGETLQVEYNTQTGAFTEGLVVTASGGGTGVIVADHDDGATGDLILKNTRGTFTGTITDTATGSATIGSTRAISTQKTPLGVLAGVTYFGAPGMSFVLAQIEPGAETDYSLTDDDGITQNPPSLVSVAVTQVEAGDRIAVFRTVGGSIVKDEYASHATNNAQDDETFEVTTTISSEAPTNDGWIRVPYDQASQLEDRYFYTSFATTIFALKVIPDSTVTTGDVNGLTFTATGSSFITEGVEVGMMVRNASDGNSIGTIASFTANTITLEERLAGGTENDFDNGDVIHINTLVRAYDATDDVYVPFLDEVATGTTVNTTIVYSAPINTLIRVRQGGVIVPFETTSSIGATGMSVGAVRTPDTIAT